MKNVLTRLVLSGALALSIAISAAPWVAPAAHAQTKFPTYTSGVQVQNLESSDALVTLTAYESDGSVDATIGPDTIVGNGSKTYFPLGVTDGFQGSMVISADKQVAAIANILSSDFSAGASYVASNEGSTTVSLPLLNKDNSGFTTWFAIQNTGSSDANITINYSSSEPNKTDVLKPNAAKVYYQENESGHGQAVFSAQVTSDQPIVASVIQESSEVMFAYTGFTGGATNPVLPLINANNANYITGVQIQNTGNTATNVTLSYTPVIGTACTETQTVQPGASNTFALQAFANGTAPNGGSTNCAGGARFVGSAQVTANSANQELAVIVNQLLPGVNGEAYSAFDPADASDTIVMPLIQDRRGGFATGFNVQNVGNSPTTVTCTFSGGVSYTVSATLQPGEALNDLQGNKIQDNYAGSATCTASGGGSIFGVVNELNPSNVDNLLTYEATNVSP